MADGTGKFPPSHAARAKRLEAAFEAYLKELNLLKKERIALMERFMKRVESGKIDDIRSLLKNL